MMIQEILLKSNKKKNISEFTFPKTYFVLGQLSYEKESDLIVKRKTFFFTF